MPFQPLKPRCCTIAYAAILVVLSVLATARRTDAQADVGKRIVHELVGLSGYWFSSSSADRALGSPKFGGDAAFYVPPARRGHLLVTGGPEFIGANDHWQPFSGGNSFSLSGASFRISTRRRQGQPVPFVSAGLFWGHINSVRENFSESKLVPSIALGAEMKVQRYVSITARYRISGRMHGVDTDGFSLGLKFF